eukprot:TRINITY_DN2810_c0_g2_i1.p1 TRINITY_DN2810_c0_g2~~TRINITY_DN2810_c0_g2_i1.p1  ORF type:complete len:400 (+),score=125.60 TRINITY_DN2810_c0_g2_i1:105-1304(+)
MGRVHGDNSFLNCICTMNKTVGRKTQKPSVQRGIRSPTSGQNQMKPNLELDSLNPTVTARILRKLKFTSFSTNPPPNAQVQRTLPQQSNENIAPERKTIKAERSEIDALKSKLEQTQENYLAMIQNLKDQLKEAQKGRQADLGLTEEELQEKIKAYEEANEVNSVALAQTKEYYVSCELQHNELQSQYEKLKEEVERLRNRKVERKSSETSPSRGYDSQSLEEENSRLRTTLSQLQGEIESKLSSEQYQKDKSERQELLHQHITALRIENEDLQRQKEEVQQLLKETEEKHQRLISNPARVEELTQLREKRDKDTEELRVENARLKASLEKCKKDVETLSSLTNSPQRGANNADTPSKSDSNANVNVLAQQVVLLRNHVQVLVETNNKLNEMIQKRHEK